MSRHSHTKAERESAARQHSGICETISDLLLDGQLSRSELRRQAVEEWGHIEPVEFATAIRMLLQAGQIEPIDDGYALTRRMRALDGGELC